MLSTKIFASILLILSLLGIYVGWGISTEFMYEPLGPRPFPVGTLALIAFCAILLFFFAEDTEIHYPSLDLWKKLIILVVSLFLFAILFEYLGFILCTSLLMFIMAMLFGATWLKAIVFSIPCSVFLYYLFDSLLQITLPFGYIFE